MNGLLDGDTPPPLEDRANILIVDDLPEKLLVFETILEDLGQNLVIVRSGSEALREVLRREFAVILMDVNMPGIDGLETARLIRGYRRSAHTPIIFVTAYADELQTSQGYSLGAVDYILSPVIPDVLRSKVRVFVDLYIMQQRLQQQALERIAIARAEAAQRAAEENTRRSIFLAQAGRVLADSLDADVGMRRLLALLVPRFAPRALLWLRDTGRGHERVLRCDAPAGQPETPIYTEGREDVLSEVLYSSTRDALEALAAPDARCDEGSPSGQAMPRCDTGHGVVLPLVTGERVLGGLLLCDPHRPPDWPTLEELAGRAAIAFENARLYGALQAEIIERRQAENSLLEASRRKDEFLAMLSHELRNPLAPIRNAVEVMRQLGAASDARLGQSISVTDRQVKHLTRLVDELLDVARISQGKIVLKTETVDLTELVSQGLEPVQPLIASQDQTLVVSMPEGPVWMRGDGARLIQVVTNLLHNAAKYTGPQGRIELTLSTNEAGIDLMVRDNGRGIEPSLLPHVFDLFEQGPRGLDRTQGGLGVGLTLVQRLVELHHGTVRAHSAGPGQGSEFHVHLPVPQQDEVPAASVAPALAAAAPGGWADKPRATPARACRVLVVDDNRDAAESMAVFLELAGFDTAVELDGPGAIQHCAIGTPRVVLLDIGLPGLDGYEVAQRIRALPAMADALLIALTGYGQMDDRRRAHEAGFDVHLVKPADPDAVVDLIEEWRLRDQAARETAPQTEAQADGQTDGQRDGDMRAVAS
ncbi:hybrid sensor histidine kinase/response regulator [Roseateles terrae]|uniref:histidine kinase n=1 Tax=Roseateles terrae TaxID=431060 RepID=A0ABR6GRX8_9BURK|nr:response regulator [Roseateles terrae]MBB3194868.1 signal transduction histidine kinase/DNA-binding response OmpR family regulator [Roseateles terrae]